MRVLLTGASGFVGHHTARALAAHGHDLRLLVRPSSDLSPLADLPHERVDIPLDGPNPSPFAGAMSGIDAVLHIAALTIAARESDFRRVNAQATAALATAAARAGVQRFLYVSSLAAQGPSPDSAPADPSGPRRPITPYGISKATGELAVLAHAKAMHVQIIRPPVVYGPRDLGLLPFFQMANRHLITRIGDGRNRVSVIYGPDLADAILAMLDQPPRHTPIPLPIQMAGQADGPPADPPADRSAEPPPEPQDRPALPAIFHIADAGGPYDWRTLSDALAAAYDHRLLTIPLPDAAMAALAQFSETLARRRNTRPSVDRSRVIEMRQPAWLADNDRLTAATGWTPTTPLNQGLAQTLRWYRDNNWL